jgi:hypothetical protein
MHSNRFGLLCFGSEHTACIILACAMTDEATRHQVEREVECIAAPEKFLLSHPGLFHSYGVTNHNMFLCLKKANSEYQLSPNNVITEILHFSIS